MKELGLGEQFHCFADGKAREIYGLHEQTEAESSAARCEGAGKCGDAIDGTVVDRLFGEKPYVVARS